jgi:hypothetical protein
MASWAAPPVISSLQKNRKTQRDQEILPRVTAKYWNSETEISLTNSNSQNQHKSKELGQMFPFPLNTKWLVFVKLEIPALEAFWWLGLYMAFYF